MPRITLTTSKADCDKPEDGVNANAEPVWPATALHEGNEFLVLEPIIVELRRRNKALLAVGIMALVLILATLAG